ncbi:MAG: toxin-antitoxin system HicB family antitoxin [Gemmatimonadaceae bacterium]|nr:toxin-antitoxin system HicB family antitoxin [Gemmatimonadaceae bacterium]
MAEKKSFLLRLDPAVHDAMQRWAADELRSLNSHIEFVLRQALRQSGRATKAGTADDAPVPAPDPDVTEST